MTRSLFLQNGLPLRASTVPQFCRMYSLSRQTTYNMINRGQLKSVLQGGRRLILVDSAEKLLAAPGLDVGLIAYTSLKLRYTSISD
jgi:hypothetical protein